MTGSRQTIQEFEEEQEYENITILLEEQSYPWRSEKPNKYYKVNMKNQQNLL